MPSHPVPVALPAVDVPLRTTPSRYPEPFASRMRGRRKRALGDVFGLAHFGVNLVTLAPGAESALRHAHSRQDEFIYVLSGSVRLEYGTEVRELGPGMCAGFPAGTGLAHRLVNAADTEAVYLEVGDRTAGDEVVYPDDDLTARFVSGAWVFCRKDGRPY